MLLYLTVKPNQRSNRIERVEKGWMVRLAAPATEGLANEELVKFIAAILKVPRSTVKLIKGHTSRIKCLDVPLDKEAVDEVFRAAAS
ncbi:MAG: DUF167 domain-containing protein [Flavobacteriales bacterium]